MFRMALRTLRFRAGAFTAAFLALFLGGVIVMACGGLMATGISAAVPPQRLAAAQVVVTGDLTHAERSRLDAGLVTAVRSVPGVASAVPDLSFPATVLRGDQPAAEQFQPSGHGWSSAALAPYTLTGGAAPQQPGEVVLDAAYAQAAGVRTGDQVDLASGGGRQRFRVTGLASAASVHESGSPSVFFTDAEADRLAGTPGRVDSIGVVLQPGADAGAVRSGIENALSGKAVSVLTGDERGLAEFGGVSAGAESLVAISAVFGGLAVMVAVFVVASTLALSVQQRYQELALLRAIGGTPGQVRRMVVGESLVLAVLATALAWWPSGFVGPWLLNQLATRGVLPTVVVYNHSWVPTVAGMAIGLLTALGAAFIAGRGAARARPTDALVEASVQRRWLSTPRVLFAVLCLGGGLALTIVTATVMTGPVAASTAGPMALLWAGGLALLGPGITRVLIAVLRWPLRAISGQAGHLAMQNAASRRIRLAGAVTPIMLATGLATAFLYMQISQTHAAEQAYTENLRADAVLRSATGGFPLGYENTVRGVPGVAAACAIVPTTAYFPGTSGDPENTDPDADSDVAVLGVSASGVAGTFAATPTSGSLSDLTGQTIALSTSDADTLGRKLGDTMPLRLDDGAELQLKVVAIFPGRPGYETALLPAQLVAEHTTSRLVPQILVRATPGTDTAQLTSQLAGLAAQQPGLRVATREEILAGAAQQEQTGAWVNYLLVAMIVGYTVIALVNTQVIATGERRREFAMQRLIGSTRGQIIRSVCMEAILVALSGVVLGTAVAAITLAAFGAALNGDPVPTGPLWIYLAIAGAATALTLLATLLTTRLVLRTPPVQAATAPR
ncbi:FtsX-like permease family protein [Actinocrispum sp. NPDC049592]|uniref:ABC transporter permease n=1 Tax=Actinocrispum sp. NPDC049592 TaxID=3154835 RepID=UPI0034263399